VALKGTAQSEMRGMPVKSKIGFRGADDFTGGSGLDLSTVERVVDHLGWGIRHEPNPNGGSRFTLQLPDSV
jgi:Signal transduction histidine kinase